LEGTDDGLWKPVPRSPKGNFRPFLHPNRGPDMNFPGKNLRIVFTAAGLALALFLSLLVTAQGSSHREAPLITEDPVADNTDVYAFVSPDDSTKATLISNFIPFEEPAGGPNFFKFGDDVLYEINIDNNGDAVRDVWYEFRFKTTVEKPDTFLYNTGPITSLDDADWNIRQSYTVTRVQNGERTVIGTGLDTPPVNIGPRSTPSATYLALAADAVHELDGIKVFAGQRDDPFYVDLGSVFDLAGLRPFNPAHIIPLGAEPGVDGVSGYNTHTIAIQVPIDQLTRDQELPTGPGDPEAVIGVWSKASRRKTRVLREPAADENGVLLQHLGPWRQVSRLANPLINEAVIPLGKKDFWNVSDPSEDEQFLEEFTTPEVTALENALYPVLDDAPETGRGDLVAVLLTGVPSLNFTGDTKADLIRLNTGIAPTAAVGAGNRLGVLAGDFAGFPNGRRLEDDVTDIELRAFACGYGPIVGPIIEGFGFCDGNANRSPNNLLGDGVDENDLPFLTVFPYLSTPHQGYAHEHDHQ
jgi:hypothetical protein